VPAGDERPGRIPADIVFTIAESPHPVFKREGNDLVYTARLPLADALSGTTVNFMHLDGRPVSVPVQEVSPASKSAATFNVTSSGLVAACACEDCWSYEAFPDVAPCCSASIGGDMA